MIVKKIKNPRKSATKSARIGSLLDYILNPQNKNKNEKCVYARAQGFFSDTPHGRKAEMLALSEEAVRSKDTVNHYVISWQEGELPRDRQIDEAVTIFLDELGLTEHQVVFGLHHDTDNVHLHIVVNRVHPDTLKVIKPNKGFDIEAAHKAIARIEHIQGWRREPNGRYQVMANGELNRENSEKPKRRQPDQVKVDKEQQTGEKSAERIGIEVAAPIIKRATDWQSLHRQLAAKGMRYVQKGSGALLYIGAVAVKPSSVDRAASLPKLQRRLGPYEPPTEQLKIMERTPEPIHTELPGWDKYIEKRKANNIDKNHKTTKLHQRQQTEREQLAAEQKAQRVSLLQGPWAGQGDLLNALRSVLAAEQASAKAELKAIHCQQRQQLRTRFKSFPDYETWLRESNEPQLAEIWRHRRRRQQTLRGETPELPSLRDIRGFRAVIRGRQVYYFNLEEGASNRTAAFVDKGSEIVVYEANNRDCILAALQLAAQKWGHFKVNGSDEFKLECYVLAVEHGFNINNLEFQELFDELKQQSDWDNDDSRWSLR